MPMTALSCSSPHNRTGMPSIAKTWSAMEGEVWRGAKVPSLWLQMPRDDGGCQQGDVDDHAGVERAFQQRELTNSSSSNQLPHFFIFNAGIFPCWSPTSPARTNLKLLIRRVPGRGSLRWRLHFLWEASSITV